MCTTRYCVVPSLLHSSFVYLGENNNTCIGAVVPTVDYFIYLSIKKKHEAASPAFDEN